MTRPLSGAVISPCARYRYTLMRRWSRDDESAFATFVMLNPSTADAEVDDPTIRRCVGFAKAWGMGALHVLNLYALRSTDPKGLWQVDDPVGPENDRYLTDHAMTATRAGWPLVAAWGANARPERVAAVLALPGMRSLQALGTTKNGAPRHPLYLPAAAQLRPWPADPATQYAEALAETVSVAPEPVVSPTGLPGYVHHPIPRRTS